MKINRKILVIPCLTTIFIFMNIDLDLDFEIDKYFAAKRLTFLNKSEPYEFKRILLWNKYLRKRDFKLDIE